MTNEREREIEAREKAATPGPLRAEYRPAEDCEEDWQSGWWVGNDGSDWIHIGGLNDKADAAFHAHAREDTPYLLAQLREARGKLKVLDAWREANHICPVDYCCWSAALAGLDRILNPQEAE